MVTYQIFPKNSNQKQTEEINILLEQRGIEPKLNNNYTVQDIFEILPSRVFHNGKIGYLFVGYLGIEYTSLNPDYKVNLVYSACTIPNNDIYDCFIEMLRFLNENNIKG